MNQPLRVTVWGENVHEHKHPAVGKIYPKGMHQCIADAINADQRFQARTATLQEPEHGLAEETLQQTDVLTWWGHCAHQQVKDEVVERIYNHVLQGMGLIVLHSGHMSKIFRRILGTSGTLCWREAGEKERIWVCNPSHPIAKDLDPYFELQHEEMYGEPFGIPEPDELVFISWFQGGEVFRSGATWKRGHGKIFYFRPGHETYPTYHDPNVQKVIRNAVAWATPTLTTRANEFRCPRVDISKAPEPITLQGESIPVHTPLENRD